MSDDTGHERVRRTAGHVLGDLDPNVGDFDVPARTSSSDLAMRAGSFAVGVALGAAGVLAMMRLSITPTELGAYGSMMQGIGSILAVGMAAWLISVTLRQVGESQAQTAITVRGQQTANRQIVAQVERQSALDTARLTERFLLEAITAASDSYYVARTFFDRAKQLVPSIPGSIALSPQLEQQWRTEVSDPLQSGIANFEGRLDRAEALLALLEARASAEHRDREQSRASNLRQRMKSLRMLFRAVAQMFLQPSTVRPLQDRDFDFVPRVAELRQAVDAFQLAAGEALLDAYGIQRDQETASLPAS